MASWSNNDPSSTSPVSSFTAPIQTFIIDLIYNHRNDRTLPDFWQVVLQRIFLIQIIIANIYCIRAGRWVPSSAPYSVANKKTGNVPWPVRQFHVMLGIQSAFYIVEMMFSGMFVKFSTMAIHHIVAMVIFSSIVMEPNCISFIALGPFIVHAIYWSLNTWDNRILMFYNLFLLACGMIGLYNNILLGPKHRPISNFQPLMAICLAWTNFITYCIFYSGYYCLPLSNVVGTEWLAEVFERCVFAALMISLCIGFVRWSAIRGRAKGSAGILMKVNTTTYHALPSHIGDGDVMEANEKVENIGFGVKINVEGVSLNTHDTSSGRASVTVEERVKSSTILATSPTALFNHGIPSPPLTPTVGRLSFEKVLEWFGSPGGGKGNVVKDEDKLR
ncbi:hypothetical protein HDU76_008653 [Blyttiomyces sp. JEL0837]|nr:hypothetical protein HDU76_008653 [Blyttiomyces sp. JEL0837]